MKKPVSIPPNYFYLCVFLCIILRIVLPEYRIVPFPFDLTGNILIIAGIYLVIDSMYLFRKHNTPESFEPATHLVQDRIFRYSRNPMYLGGVLILIGLSVTLNNMISLVTPLIFFLIMNYMFIPYEERELENTFGKNFINYRKKVRRWI